MEKKFHQTLMSQYTPWQILKTHDSYVALLLNYIQYVVLTWKSFDFFFGIRNHLRIVKCANSSTYMEIHMFDQIKIFYFKQRNKFSTERLWTFSPKTSFSLYFRRNFTNIHMDRRCRLDSIKIYTQIFRIDIDRCQF